ncbi:hypothetical protein ACWN74_09560 [Vagococcus lutrae]
MTNFSLFIFLASIISLFVFLIKSTFETKKYALAATLSIILSFSLFGSAIYQENVRFEKELKAAQLTEQEATKKLSGVQESKQNAERKLKKAEEEKQNAENKLKEEQKVKQNLEEKLKEVEEAKQNAEKKLKEEQEAKKSVEEKLKEAQTTKENQVVSEQTQEANQQNERTVYIAPQSGRKFHYSSNCRGLKRANSVSAISISEATSQGYDLCGFEK